MKFFKTRPLLSLVNGYLIDAPQPSNLSYLWNFVSLLAFCFLIQIVTVVTLAMYYNPSVAEAFNSVEHIIRDVNNAWLMRYLHSNTASAFFFLVYLQVGRGLYYGWYKAPRTLVWIIGIIILVLMTANTYLGYFLPYNKLCSFTTYLAFPIILFVLALMHFIALHDRAGSGNLLGIPNNYIVIIKYLSIVLLFIFILLFLFLIIGNFNVVYCCDGAQETQAYLKRGIILANEMAQYWNEQVTSYEVMIREESNPANRQILERDLEATRVNRDQAIEKSNRYTYQLSQGSNGWLNRDIELGKRELPTDSSSCEGSSSSKRKR